MAVGMTLEPQGNIASRVDVHVDIESFNSESVYAEDGMIPVGTRYTISGTAVMSKKAFNEIQDDMAIFTTRMKSIVIEAPAGQKLVELKSTESLIGGPFLKHTATDIMGTGASANTTVLLRFEINDETSWCDRPVAAHTWVTRWSIDAAGRATRTINGNLRMVKWSTKTSDTAATRSDWTDRKPFADLFRRYVAPSLPQSGGSYQYGWRRESQEYAYDIHSSSLIWSVVDKHHLHDLPEGVRVGNMDFTYERSAQDAGLAHCTFTCDLEGPTSLSAITGTTGNRKLIECAIALSKTRLNASFNGILITRMRITERDMLSSFAIRFEIEASAYPVVSGSPNIVALGQMVGRNFHVVRTTTAQVDPYGEGSTWSGPSGGGGIYKFWSPPHWLENVIDGMNCGTSYGTQTATSYVFAAEDSTFGAVTVNLVDSADGLTALNNAFAGQYKDDVKQPAPAGDGYSQIVAHSVSLSSMNLKSGIVALSTMYVDGADFVFQTQKPVPLVTERIEVSRTNTAPSKVIRPMPSGGHLVSESWDVAFGKFDSQGNRVFTGVFQRTYALYDMGGTTTNGFATALTTRAGYIRVWDAPSGKFTPTLSPTASDASQIPLNSVFGAAQTPEQSYPVHTGTFLS